MAILLLLFICVASGLFTFLFWSIASLIGAAGVPAGTAPLYVPFAVLLIVFGIAGLSFALRGLRRVTLPMGDLIEAADRVAEGDYTARVQERGPVEVQRLARTFNSMASRLETDAEQRRNQLAEVAHELRTPLAVIQGNLEALVDGLYPLERHRLEGILDETRLLSRLIEDLQTLALVESGALQLQKEATDLTTLAGETVASFKPQADATGIQLQVQAEKDIPLVEVDPARMRQILANVLANALRYTPRGGQIDVRCATETGSEKKLVIVIQDSGMGIAPENLPHIFDRSFKSPDSRGSGLGLTIAKNLVDAHGGKISAESRPGQGTTIRISLPLTQ